MTTISLTQAKISATKLKTSSLATTHNQHNNFNRLVSHSNHRIIPTSQANPLCNLNFPNISPRLTNSHSNLNINPNPNTIHSLRLQTKLPSLFNSSLEGKRKNTILQFRTQRNIWFRLKKRLSVFM